MSKNGNVGSFTYPTTAGTIKKNGYVILKNNPCKVVDISISKTGKHGHAKAHIIGIDLFTGKRYEDIAITSHNVKVPYVEKNEFLLTDITEDQFMVLMNDQGKLKEDLKLNDGELSQRIKEKFEEGEEVQVFILSSMGVDHLVDFKIVH